MNRNFHSILFLILLFNSLNSNAQTYLENKTVTYAECISFYKNLAAKYPNSKLNECGLTDIGKPLHVFVITDDGDFDVNSIRKKNKRMVLINNGIHPGEPPGVDACISLSTDLLTKPEMKKLLQHTVICVIPIYNVDGALNRNSFSRANQNGPESYGFRANSLNLDLNRDFIKCDAANTKSFIEIFQKYKPDIFVDTHISNGADYPYTMTLIATQHNKLNPLLADYMTKNLVPALYDKMEKRNWEMCPYVESIGETPETGLSGFLESPRFSTGYAALFNTISFVTETHMLKPYPNQVKATYAFLISILEKVNEDYLTIGKIKQQADEQTAKQNHFDLDWKLDTTNFVEINFKGFTALHKKSNVTGLDRLYYDRTQPWEKQIKYFNNYLPMLSADLPAAYIIPKQWQEVIERLKINGVVMEKISADTLMEVQSYYIANYKSPQKPYEGHFLHTEIETRSELQKVQFYKGDYLIRCNQPRNYFIATALEPKGPDSYFAWNYFDAVLQQKEYFSDYVFEEQAEEVLAENPGMKEQLQQYVKDNKLENDAWPQLLWVYRHSKYYEVTHNRYPVFRIN